MVPDYISEKKMKELKEGNCFPVMGCRSALSPWKDENGNYYCTVDDVQVIYQVSSGAVPWAELQ